MLGGLALSALKNFATQPPAAHPAIASQEAKPLVDADAAAQVLRAMLSATKADGKLDDDEVATLKAHMAPDDVTEAEAAFVNAELAKRVDIRALAAAARSQRVADMCCLDCRDQDRHRARTRLNARASAGVRLGCSDCGAAAPDDQRACGVRRAA